MGETYTFPCNVCTTITTELTNVRIEIINATSPVFADLDSMVDSVNDQLLSSVSPINDTIVDVRKLVVDVRDGTVEDVNDQYQEYVVKDATNYNDQRELAYNLMFAIPLLPLIFAILGMAFKKPYCFTLLSDFTPKKNTTPFLTHFIKKLFFLETFYCCTFCFCVIRISTV